MSLRVLDPGLATFVVDFGRPATRSLGVPPGGAADRWSLALGNALVSNRPETPALEVCLAGPRLRAECDLAAVVFGAPFELLGTSQKLLAGKTFTLRCGQELHIAGTQIGMRAYLCVRGGFFAKSILGSRSSLEAVPRGAELGCQPSTMPARFIRPAPRWNLEPRTLRVLAGPQAEWFPENGFYIQEYVITPESNRMGLRLHGQPLPFPARELVSEPACPGSIQVTSNGQCIVLGVDGQTIGGYPKIAQVISADIDKVGQLRPGETIRFQRLSLVNAQDLKRAKQVELHQWLMRLLAAEQWRTTVTSKDSG